MAAVTGDEIAHLVGLKWFSTPLKLVARWSTLTAYNASSLGLQVDYEEDNAVNLLFEASSCEASLSSSFKKVLSGGRGSQLKTIVMRRGFSTLSRSVLVNDRQSLQRNGTWILCKVTRPFLPLMFTSTHCSVRDQRAQAATRDPAVSTFTRAQEHLWCNVQCQLPIKGLQWLVVAPRAKQ